MNEFNAAGHANLRTRYFLEEDVEVAERNLKEYLEQGKFDFVVEVYQGLSLVMSRNPQIHERFKRAFTIAGPDQISSEALAVLGRAPKLKKRRRRKSQSLQAIRSTLSYSKGELSLSFPETHTFQETVTKFDPQRNTVLKSVPKGVRFMIHQKLERRDMLNLRMVCKEWNTFANQFLSKEFPPMLIGKKSLTS